MADIASGILPAPGDLLDSDEQILGHAEQLIQDIRGYIDAQAFHEALEAIWALVRAANAYVDAQAPWQLHKENPARRDTVLYVLAETIRHLGIYIQPFMPDSAAKMLNLLAC